MDYNSAMTGFTKLFSTIVHSTVWREEMHIKVVWITMLALADRKGRVLASIPGLADASRVSLEQCQEALERLGAPDPWSRTKDYEWRRIEEIDGGWQLLNYLKYRELRDDDERRLQVREAVARHRNKKAKDITVIKSNHIAEAEEEAEEEAETAPEEEKKEKPSLRSGKKKDSISSGWRLEAFGEFWAGLLRQPAPRPVHKDQARRTFSERITMEIYPRLTAALANYRTSKRIRDGYIQDASTWLNDWESWEHVPEPPAPVSRNFEGLNRDEVELLQLGKPDMEWTPEEMAAEKARRSKR